MEQGIGRMSGNDIVIETGRYARQANGSVMLRCGNTVLLATATMSKEAKEGLIFSLTVKFGEKYYAAGKFAGGYIKRELGKKNAFIAVSFD